MRVLRSALMMALVHFATPAAAEVAVGVTVGIAPPALPVYEQPAMPAEGYIWTPGYWSYGPGGYVWVPGAWVRPPQVGLLWTPAWWGWSNGAYLFHAGYWGPHVGFYGGINYGFGYSGIGFAGGMWVGGAFHYNSAVTNFGGVHVTNVYNKTVVNNVTVNRTSFNGGAGGVQARPNEAERVAAHENHFGHDGAPVGHPAMAAAHPQGHPEGGHPHSEGGHPHPEGRPHEEHPHDRR